MRTQFLAKSSANFAKRQRAQRKDKFKFFLCALCVFASFALFPSCTDRAARNQQLAVGEARPKWTRSRVIGYPDPPLPYTTENAFPKLKVFQPLYILQQPGSDQYLLLQHLGNRAGPA